MENINLTPKIVGSELYGLAYNCPYRLRIDGCPFKVIDKYFFKEKVDWIKGLNIEEKENILEYHFFCSQKRNPKHI